MSKRSDFPKVIDITDATPDEVARHIEENGPPDIEVLKIQKDVKGAVGRSSTSSSSKIPRDTWQKVFGENKG